MEMVFKDVNVREYRLTTHDDLFWHYATISKNTETAREYHVRLPKESYNGSYFGKCTCGVTSKEGIPCRHMVVLVKHILVSLAIKNVRAARDSVDDRVKGLELGADDYLIKPFAFSEVLARVRTLLRRGQAAPQSELLQVADLQLDIAKRKASRSGAKITLSNQEFSLLELLMRRRGEVLPRSLIASQVWDMNFDSDTNVIDVAIRRLRAKIDDGFAAKLIHTVRGMGYKLDDEQTDA